MKAQVTDSRGIAGALEAQKDSEVHVSSGWLRPEARPSGDLVAKCLLESDRILRKQPGLEQQGPWMLAGPGTLYQLVSPRPQASMSRSGDPTVWLRFT